MRVFYDFEDFTEIDSKNESKSKLEKYIENDLKMKLKYDIIYIEINRKEK